MKKRLTKLLLGRFSLDAGANRISPNDPSNSVCRGVNLLSLFISLLMLIGCPFIYMQTHSAGTITMTATGILGFYSVIALNYSKKQEAANVLFYLLINALALVIDPFMAEPGGTMLVYFFLLSLIIFLFERTSTRLVCMVIIITRILLFQINSKYIASEALPISGVHNDWMRWTLNIIVLCLILFVFALYAFKLLRADELSKKNSLFFQHMSHDLQIAYYSVASICALLKNAIDSQKTLKNETAVVNELMNASSFCSYILNNFLEYSRFENGMLHSNHYEEIDLGSEIEKIVALHSYITDEKSIRIEVYIDDYLPGLITSDRIKVNRIFLNLLSNAIKNTPPGKSIYVRLEPDNARWKLSVINEGEGLNEEAIQNLFLPYSENGTKDRQKKLGLGLPITKVLVEALGGKIMASSRANKETRFTVAIPLL